VGAIVAGLRVAKRVDQIARQLDQDIKPILANITAVSNEAARTAALAARQVERVDELFGDVASRVDQMLALAQAFVSGPARQGLAVVSGVRAAYDAFRHLRDASRRRQPARSAADDDESLFIG
jgi:phosphate uptake regulator